jgi:hypothetical protein
VLTAPLLVFVAGQIWYRHAWQHWRRGVRHRRRSGIALALDAAPMIVSGYLIQTTVDDAWRATWIAVHCAASALWLLGYLGHVVSGARRRVAAHADEALAANPS